MISETGHNHSFRDVCRREQCPAWPDVQRAKRRTLRRAKRKLSRTRLACILTGGHKWLRLHEGDGSLAFIDCRKCGFRP